MFDKECKNETDDHQRLDGSLKSLLENKIHRFNLLIYILVWIAASFSYYVAYFFIKYLQGDVFTNAIVAALSEMSGYMLTGIIYERLGLKKSYVAHFLLIAVGSALYLTISHWHPALVPILLLITVYGVSSVCMTNWLSNSRLFPVIYASSTHGIASFFARMSNILAP
jgi:Na+/melibiose symporter-like transporter